jgi:hypothetical protein
MRPVRSRTHFEIAALFSLILAKAFEWQTSIASTAVALLGVFLCRAQIKWQLLNDQDLPHRQYSGGTGPNEN